MSETKEYSVWNTPLSRLVRGKIGPRNPRLRLDPLSPVGESDLPAQAKDLITRVVRKTRLWKSEKQEIAEDLLSHFADGLDAGRPLDDLLASFGHPAKAAKLMRRAKKRNRPIWWQFLHRSRQFAAAVVLLYLGLFAWAGLSHPSPASTIRSV